MAESYAKLLETFLVVALVTVASVSASWWQNDEGTEVERLARTLAENTLRQEVPGQCRGRPCYSHGDCCGNTMCVELPKDVGHRKGHCIPREPRKEGVRCMSTDDCNFPMVCIREAEEEVGGVCQHLVEERSRRTLRKKQFSDECQSSSDCDEERQLCCQLQKRHRQTPRRVCLYYTNPKVCIGATGTNAIPQVADHSEKPSWWSYLGKWAQEPYKFATNHRYYY